MKIILHKSLLLLFIPFIFSFSKPKNEHWETLKTTGEPVARHEAGLVAFDSKLYLLGGRRINPVSVFDPKSNTWTNRSTSPIEFHHFQAVVYQDAIYIIGAMTGPWPNEKPLDRILIYYPKQDKFVFGDDIPVARKRGGAGVAIYNDKIYMVGGISHGHMEGFKNWFDEYDPATGQWKILPDAPNARDHFQAAINQGKLYAFGGRNSSRKTGQDMDLTITHGNIFDFKTQQWQKVTHGTAIPTERAGSFTFSWNDEVIIGGGESMKQELAHSEVEAFNVQTKTWKSWPSFNTGRHGSGFAIIGDYVYTASGCGKRGGSPELTSVERLKLPNKSKPTKGKNDQKVVVQKWHTLTLSFEGKNTSETDENNPFLNYKLEVELKIGNKTKRVRGFYAADGNAANSSADHGNIWQVRFNPDEIGTWTYSAHLYKGEKIALTTDTKGEEVAISNANGSFVVVHTDKENADFRSSGNIIAENGYFKFENSTKHWLKMGTNSPENLLAYEDFDGTYRISAALKDGEAKAPEVLHKYENHLQDWQQNDPTWQNGKGKSLIGAVNYLASKGMNSAYFLTMNILGDGKDVWPFLKPDDFTRFDVSKLDQWEVVFNHMEKKGVLMHLVIQETENETLLDSGDTGPMRKLYFQELIARFGHHLGLVWNLGEENGAAPWSPVGQNDAQRKAMISYLTENDPYNHPILLHTHSEDPLRSDILNDIKGFKDLDGLSLQQSKREEAGHVVEYWRKESKRTGAEWLITMDEIGLWHTGALTDSEDPNHASLRRFALWGTLLSGGAGVEWYFGAKHPHNDLSSEDWRERNRLWEVSNIARVFFEENLPYWEMKPNHSLVNNPNAYCLVKQNEIYAIYLPEKGTYTIDLRDNNQSYSVYWYDPLKGGELQIGSLKNIKGGAIQNLGNPPAGFTEDAVILLKKE